MNTIDRKYNTLQKILGDLPSAVIAFSGGVDSTFLLGTAKKILPDNLLALTFKADIIPSSEIKQAISLAASLKVKHIIIDSDILSHHSFIINDPNRCYVCKKLIFSEIVRIAQSRNLKYIMEGSNADDARDYRPGRKVLREMNILSPLAQAGLTKKEIRTLSRKMGLPTWDKPALACLATRIPYGTVITKDKIKRIDHCEQYLHNQGFTQVRVRDHGYLARLEIPKSEIKKLLNQKISSAVVKEFKNQGFTYICTDLEGYRSGSMNEVIEDAK